MLHGCQSDFGFRTAMIETVIEQRLQGHVNVLRGVVGLFDASAVRPARGMGELSPSRAPQTSTPGLQAIGFSARSPCRAAFERQIQEQRWPFAIWPAGTATSSRVVYVHPVRARQPGCAAATTCSPSRFVARR